MSKLRVPSSPGMLQLVWLLLIPGFSVPKAPIAPTEAEFHALLRRGGGSNVAVTAEGSEDPRLRPRVFPASPGEVRGRVISAILTLPRWQVQDSSGSVVWAVRTRRLFHFSDDIFILVEPAVDGSTVLVRSASRVGKGDLGQNRRNIAELWRALERSPWATPATSFGGQSNPDHGKRHS